MNNKQALSRERLDYYATLGLENSILGGRPLIFWDEVRGMARALLEVMDAKPVVWRYRTTDINGNPNPDWSFSEEASLLGLYQPLYTHPAPSIPVMQPVMFIDGDISSGDAEKLAKVIREFNEEDERPLAKMARIIRENPHPTNECDMVKNNQAPSIPAAVPAVPDEIVPDNVPDLLDSTANPDEYACCVGADMWNKCRAAMLNHIPDTGNMVKSTIMPVIPDEMTITEAKKHYSGTKEMIVSFADGCNYNRGVMLQSFGNSEQVSSPVIPEGWTDNDSANSALVMLGRIDTLDSADDARIEEIKRIIRHLAAAPKPPATENK